jgi:hypothetical protein
MDIKEGDPILSRDGTRIMAYWAISMGLQHYNNILIPMIGRMPAGFYDGSGPEDMAAETQTLKIVAHFQAPDRTYWRENSFGDVTGWEGMGKWFRPAPIDPGPSPAGMVAAYDLVLSDHCEGRPNDFVAQVLKRKQDFWKRRAEREKRRAGIRALPSWGPSLPPPLKIVTARSDTAQLGWVLDLASGVVFFTDHQACFGYPMEEGLRAWAMDGQTAPAPASVQPAPKAKNAGQV